MINKYKREYIKNKLIISYYLKFFIKSNILKSIIHNRNIKNYEKSFIIIKGKIKSLHCSKIHDICINSGVYKKSNKYSNMSRYEFHKYCRSNKLSTWSVKSW